VETPEDKPDEAAIEKDLARCSSRTGMQEERKRYRGRDEEYAPDEKFARMLIFEREFQTQVRNAMGERMRRVVCDD
jgi:hypothetical protein